MIAFYMLILTVAIAIPNRLLVDLGNEHLEPRYN
jgi:hypothetical protein